MVCCSCLRFIVAIPECRTIQITLMLCCLLSRKIQWLFITDYCDFALQCLLLLQVHFGKDFLQHRGHRASNVYDVMALLR